MPSLLDNDVDTPSAPSSDQQYPASDVVRTYLHNAGTRFFGLRSARREQPEPRTVNDLWDYLGDFA